VKVTAFPSTASGVAERLSGFMAHLRENGLAVGVVETQATLCALRLIDIGSHQEVRLACKSICTSQHQSFTQFDDLFDSYWFNHGRVKGDFKAELEKPKRNPRHTSQPGIEKRQQTTARGTAEQPDESGTEGETAHRGDGKLIAAKTTNMEKVDFRELMTPEALQQAEVVAAKLANAIRDRRSRRYRAHKTGSRLDLRHTIRNSISHGGVPLQLHKRQRPERPVKIVALLDVSGSMTVYTRIFLSFLKGLISHDTNTDAYLFHTSLVRISDALRDHDTFRAVNRLSVMAQGFGGGTKIGANLMHFNRQYAASTVNGRTVVMILSDGYDTDPPEQLASALKRLKKRNCKIIWLNPLKGWKDYAPVAAGMAAALPYLDHFAAANTLNSLAALEPQLSRL